MKQAEEIEEFLLPAKRWLKKDIYCIYISVM